MNIRGVSSWISTCRDAQTNHQDHLGNIVMTVSAWMLMDNSIIQNRQPVYMRTSEILLLHPKASFFKLTGRRLDVMFTTTYSFFCDGPDNINELFSYWLECRDSVSGKEALHQD